MPKYENAVVYKLCCDDPNVRDGFVGSTCNFNVRKWQHKINITNENSKGYNSYMSIYIRAHGGWDGWSMILLEKCPHVVDKPELLRKQIEWMHRLSTDLNTMDAMDKNDEICRIESQCSCPCGCVIYIDKREENNIKIKIERRNVGLAKY